MRSIGVVTGARADYGIYLPVLRAIAADPELRLVLIATGAHLAPEFGLTAGLIEADGFTIAERVEMLLASETPAGTASAMGLGLIGFAQLFARARPDLLLVLGDRFEMHAAALAALPFAIPVAHIHGGELTIGAIDDALRHSMTKLSHLHFVATEEYRRRVIQLGEEPWRVLVSGAPSLDQIGAIELLGRAELESLVGMALDCPPLLVTYHPVTLEQGDTAWQIGELLRALERVAGPLVFTQPNADPSGQAIARQIAQFAATHPNARMVANFGTRAYFSMMALAGAMVGNSSSGLLEAPSFELPVVNIGNRQQGRVRAANVIDVGYSQAEVEHGIARALDPAFRATLRGLVNPYGDGQAASRIVARLKDVPLDRRLIVKHFYDLAGSEPHAQVERG